LCVSHQYKIVERNLTKRPELAASKELLDIIKWLAHTDKESFFRLFEVREKRCESFVNERKKMRQEIVVMCIKGFEVSV
jgi:hypothetical protein